MKHAPPPLIVVESDESDDEPEVAWLIAQAIHEERQQLGPPAWPLVLGWSRHPEGVLVESNGTSWLIGHDDRAGVQRLAGLIRMEFSAGCAGNC